MQNEKRKLEEENLDWDSNEKEKCNKNIIKDEEV